MAEHTIMSKYVPHYDAGKSKLSIIVKVDDPAMAVRQEYVFAVLGSYSGQTSICQKRVFVSQWEQRRFTENGQPVFAGTSTIWARMMMDGTQEERDVFNRCLDYLQRAEIAFEKEYRGHGLDDNVLTCVWNAFHQFSTELKMSDSTYGPEHHILNGEDLILYANGYNCTKPAYSGFKSEEWETVSSYELIFRPVSRRLYDKISDGTLRFKHVDHQQFQYTDPVEVDGTEYLMRKFRDNGIKYLCRRNTGAASAQTAAAVSAAQGSDQGGGGIAPQENKPGRPMVYMARLLNAKGLTEFARGGVYRIKDGNKTTANGRTYIAIFNDEGEERMIDESRIRYDNVYSAAPPDQGEQAPEREGAYIP